MERTSERDSRRLSSLIFKMDFDSTILHVEIHCVLIRSIQARFQHTRTIFDPSLYRVILIPAYNISLDLSVLHRAIVLRGSWMFEHYGAVFNFLFYSVRLCF